MTGGWVRYVPPAVLATLSTVSVGFGTDAFLDRDFAWWWWVALIAGAIGLAVSTVWFNRLQSSPAPPPPPPVEQRNAGGAQQVAGDSGQNLDIDISADRGGTAAWNITGGVRNSGPGTGATGSSPTP